ncbi:hypothetical protein SAY87_012904 [Trapa incisa]|uniref:Uncharacterized protein n=1 Tax=Trapa incisa TaxID=236973 RepID=A0AAN7KAY4_9MYRT|nr:hypothetical protein SAY87_012904 [Trapa incisa]
MDLPSIGAFQPLQDENVDLIYQSWERTNGRERQIFLGADGAVPEQRQSQFRNSPASILAGTVVFVYVCVDSNLRRIWNCPYEVLLFDKGEEPDISLSSY